MQVSNALIQRAMLKDACANRGDVKGVERERRIRMVDQNQLALNSASFTLIRDAEEIRNSILFSVEVDSYVRERIFVVALRFRECEEKGTIEGSRAS